MMSNCGGVSPALGCPQRSRPRTPDSTAPGLHGRQEFGLLVHCTHIGSNTYTLVVLEPMSSDPGSSILIRNQSAIATRSGIIRTSSPLLTLYDDGGCPVCTREIGFYQHHRGAGPSLGQSHAMNGHRTGASWPEAAYAACMRAADGQLVSGARAFAALWPVLPAFRLVGRIRLPAGIVHVLEWAIGDS